MITKLSCVCVIVIACAVSTLAQADWEEGYPFTKWVQMPDPNGWDVKASGYKILADDFLCSDPLPITDIHFWGSWKNDVVGLLAGVHLSIHRDIPADQSPTGYSMPGELLWEKDYDPRRVPEIVTVREWGTGDQGWYNPNTGEVREHDHEIIWQVNVFLPEEDWFWQEGTADNPVVYWLDVKINPWGCDFGWKTSIDHWNDNAVFRDTDWPEDQPWELMTDPLTGGPLNMAFVITTIPEPGVFMLVGMGALALLRRRLR